MEKDKIKYIIGIDFGHGETTANIVDLSNPTKVDKLFINGNSSRAVKSAMCKMKDAHGEDRWVLEPDESRLKRALKSKDPNAPLELYAYFKGVVDGGVNTNHSIVSPSPEHFGIYIKEIYSTIIINPANAGRGLLTGEQQNFLLFIACPSDWTDAQIVAFKSFIANLDVPCQDVIKESNAAWIVHKPVIIDGMRTPNVLVIDFGSSTIDYTWVGNERIVNGVLLGASYVESAIFDYIIKNSSLARDAFDDALKYINDKDVLEDLITYLIRCKKEEFYNELALDPEGSFAVVQPLDLKQSIIGASGIFGLEDGDITTEVMDAILTDYISKVRTSMSNFKKCGRTDYDKFLDSTAEIVKPEKIILTGGASRMPFVQKIIKDVFGIEPIIDDDPSFCISRGITLYGVTYFQSYNVKNEVDSIFETEWFDTDNLSKRLCNSTRSIAQTEFYNGLLNIFEEWQEGNIKFNCENNLNEILIKIHESILEDKKRADEMEVEYDKKNELGETEDQYFLSLKINHEQYNKVVTLTSEWGFLMKSMKNDNVDGNRSLHALFWEIYDFLSANSVKDKISIISNSINASLKKQLTESIHPLLSDYIKAYFPATKPNDISEVLSIDFNEVSIVTDIKEETRLKLIKLIVNKAIELIHEKDAGGVYHHTLNKDRDENYRKSRDGKPAYFEDFKTYFKEFAESLYIELVDADVTAHSIAEQVRKKRDDIYNYCTNIVQK